MIRSFDRRCSVAVIGALVAALGACRPAAARARSTRRPAARRAARRHRRSRSEADPGSHRAPTAGRSRRPGRRNASPRLAARLSRAAMHHFAYRDGVLHAEAVDLASLAEAVGTPFYCYSTATLERHYRVFADAFADVPSLVCYAMKANSNQAVIATLARLGAGADVVSDGELQARARRRRAAGQDHVLRRRQDRARSSRCALDEGILCFNVESEPELELLSAIAAGKGRDRARLGARQSGRRRQDPRQDRDRQGREQVRHSDQPRARGLCPRRQAAGPARRRRRHAYRQPDHRACSRSTMPSRCCRISCATLRADGHAIAHVDLGGGLGIPYRDDNEPPPDPDAYADDRQARDARPRLQADLRARPPDRRQCRHPGDARALREARRGQDLRHRRCRR